MIYKTQYNNWSEDEQVFVHAEAKVLYVFYANQIRFLWNFIENKVAFDLLRNEL